MDTEYFGGLREAVLERDGNRCRVCNAPDERKREMIVHTGCRALMIALCPGCHAKVHQTKAVLTVWPCSLLKLWRDQHSTGHEQTMMNFSLRKPPAKPAPSFL